MTLLFILFALALAAVHLFAGQMKFLDVVPRSGWLSLAGGVAVSYVLVHLLPELSAAQLIIEQSTEGFVGFLEHHVYLMALLGLTVFYGLERIAKESRSGNKQHDEVSDEATTSPQVFWLHIASFSLYNMLIGYLLLHREEKGVNSAFFYFFAMTLHFLTHDYGLRQHHKQRYDGAGRWILATAILVGFVLGLFASVDEAALAVLFAFLAGGVILNVLKEELPNERKSRFLPFALGAAGYTFLLLLAV